MQPRGAFYIRISAAILLLFLVSGGVYDSVQAKSATVSIGSACVPTAHTSAATMATVISAPYGTGSAGASYGFTLTYPSGGQLTGRGYDIWQLTAAKPGTPLTPLRDYAVYMGHENVVSATQKNELAWPIPADYAAGTYEIVPTALSAAGLALQGTPYPFTVRSDSSAPVIMEPGAGTSSIASNPGSQDPTVLVVGDLVNTTDAARTVKVTWNVTDPSNPGLKGESYYNTVVVPANTPSMEIAHTFNRTAYSVMSVSGSVQDQDVVSTSYFFLTGLKPLHFEFDDVNLTHTSSALRDTYTVQGCAAAPPLSYASLVSKPVTVQYAVAGVTASTRIGAKQAGSVIDITEKQSLFAAPSTIQVKTIVADGEIQTHTLAVPGGSHARLRTVLYAVACIFLLLTALIPWKRRRTYMRDL